MQFVIILYIFTIKLRIYGITIERIARTVAKSTACHLDSFFTALLNTTSTYNVDEEWGSREAIK